MKSPDEADYKLNNFYTDYLMLGFRFRLVVLRSIDAQYIEELSSCHFLRFIETQLISQVLESPHFLHQLGRR
eukprot:m.99178 g.99178  ORF g.99178 m.99178 type:complete len:72 (+) comp37049_c0_seq1:1638-1853(+)